MSDIILHHFDISPFAEKIRLVMGLKGLAWHSVRIPLVMPKPDLTALTGGYRKTPVMQIGSDIYCDTQCIARELDRRFPQPSLFPSNSEALCMALSHWSDSAFFQPGSGLSLATNTGLPEAILSDRKAFFSYLDFASLQQDLPHFYSQFAAHLHLLESMLKDGRPFILGDAAAWADMLAYFPLWMARANISGSEQLLAGLSHLALWERRVEALGHGDRKEITASQALAMAQSSRAATVGIIAAGAWPFLDAGTEVIVTPQDYGAVPVRGNLHTLSHSEIAVRRSDERAGELIVHFPRIGYRVELA